MQFFNTFDRRLMAVAILAILVIATTAGHIASAKAGYANPNVTMYFGAEYGPYLTDYTVTKKTWAYDGADWNATNKHGGLFVTDTSVELRLNKGQELTQATGSYVNPQSSAKRPHPIDWDGRKPLRRTKYLVTAKHNKHMLVLTSVNVSVYESGLPPGPEPK